MKVKTEAVLKLKITGKNADAFKKLFKRLDDDNTKVGFNHNNTFSKEEKELIKTISNNL